MFLYIYTFLKSICQSFILLKPSASTFEYSPNIRKPLLPDGIAIPILRQADHGIHEPAVKVIFIYLTVWYNDLQG